MKTFKITGPGDIPVAASRTLGFEPEESLVILAVGGGPSIRVDLDPVGVIADALAPALRHWRASTLIVLGYSDDPLKTLHVVDVARWLVNEGLEVFTVGHVIGGVVSTTLGEATYEPSMMRRSDMVSLAATCADADEADDLGVKAWRAGQGALAWCYVDRATELRGGAMSKRARLLERALTEAIDPRATPEAVS